MPSLSAESGIPRTSCFKIVTEKLKFKKVSAKWVPHEINFSQKQVRVDYSRVNLKTYNQQKSRLENTLAIDETWIRFNRPPEKDQAPLWLREGEKPTTLAVPNRYGPKLMCIMAMDKESTSNSV